MLNLKVRKIVFILFVLSTLCIMTGALAGSSIGGNTSPSAPVAYGKGDLVNRLYNILDFKFFNKKGGIGYGVCPVYTAPSESAFRLANGKACCDTDTYMSVAGYDVTGWLLVRYETNNGGTRVGYIPPSNVRGYKADIARLDFDYIPAKALDTIYVTDNPLLEASAFAVLEPDEPFHVLAKYTYFGNWWYIECYVDDQLARGFIDRDTSDFMLEEDSSLTASSGSGTILGQETRYYRPDYSPLGTSCMGSVTMTGDSHSSWIVRRSKTTSSDMVARVHGGETYPCYAAQSGEGQRDWYYIWIDGVWGWVSSGVSILYK